MEEQSAERREPEAECIQARERHVPGPDHQRHEVVRESEHHRHGDEEDHRRAVHGEQPIEGLWRDEVVERPDELDAHQARFDPGDYQEEQRIDDVEGADALVIGGVELRDLAFPLPRFVIPAQKRRAGAGEVIDQANRLETRRQLLRRQTGRVKILGQLLLEAGPLLVANLAERDDLLVGHLAFVVSSEDVDTRAVAGGTKAGPTHP